MGGKIIIILLLVMAMGVGLYLVRSGAVGKIVSTLDFAANRFSPATSTPVSGQDNAHPFGDTIRASEKFKPTLPPPQVLPPQQWPAPPPQEKINPSDIPEGFTADGLSPYFHKIRIGTVYSGSQFSDGQVSLYASFYSSTQLGTGPSTNIGTSGGEAINVSGWLLDAREGSQFVPQAVGIYDPSGLTAESDIYLKSGDVLNIYSGVSAIHKNLHLNKCLGFLENTNNFTPSLPRNCPYINRREIQSFSGRCQDYIMSLGYCRLPDSNPPVPESDDACRSYLNTINYKGCFDRYRIDPDFLSHEWRAWSGAKFLDERHDRLLLLDKKGLLVDLYEY